MVTSELPGQHNICKAILLNVSPLLGNSGQVGCFCHHANCSYCEGPQPVQRTVSAACLYAIVWNGTAKPAVSLETRFSGENRDRKKKTAQLGTSRIGNLWLFHTVLYLRDDRAYCTDDTNTPSSYVHKL